MNTSTSSEKIDMKNTKSHINWKHWKTEFDCTSNKIKNVEGKEKLLSKRSSCLYLL